MQLPVWSHCVMYNSGLYIWSNDTTTWPAIKIAVLLWRRPVHPVLRTQQGMQKVLGIKLGRHTIKINTGFFHTLHAGGSPLHSHKLLICEHRLTAYQLHWFGHFRKVYIAFKAILKCAQIQPLFPFQTVLNLDIIRINRELFYLFVKTLSFFSQIFCFSI